MTCKATDGYAADPDLIDCSRSMNADHRPHPGIDVDAETETKKTAGALRDAGRHTQRPNLKSIAATWSSRSTNSAETSAYPNIATT